MNAPKNQNAIRRQLGATILEVAFIMPIFLMLLFGVMDFGRILWVGNAAGYAAAEGVRLAAMYEPTDTDVITYVQTTLQQQGITLPSQITVENRVPGELTRVRVAVDVNFLVIPAWAASAANLSQVVSTSMAVHEP